MKKLIIILALISLTSCGWLKGGDKSVKIPAITVYHDVIQRTADGTAIASKSGVTQSVLDTANASLRELFTDARAKGYQNNLDASVITIYALADCVLSPESHTPSFLVRADNYDGSDYDQYNPKGKGVADGIGQIYAAEYVVFEPTGQITNEYVICTEASGQPVDLGLIFETVRYGKEHRILADNDYQEYLRTQTHTDASNAHPIVPRRAQ